MSRALFLIFLALTASAACRNGTARERRPSLVVTDDLQKSVVLDRPARRIASLAPAYTEILFAVGCGDRIVVRDSRSDFPAEVSRRPATDGMSLPTEHILSFRPDLVLVYQANPARLDTLLRSGTAVASFDPRSFVQIEETVRKLGVLCGNTAQAEKVVSSMRSTLEDVRRRVGRLEKPLVYAEVDGSDPARPWTAGPGSYVNEIIELAGGANLAHDLGQSWGVLSQEEIIRRDPEVILIVGTGTDRAGDPAARFRERPGWDRIRAVARSRVVDDIPEALLSRPGPRLAEGLRALARELHPEAWSGS